MGTESGEAGVAPPRGKSSPAPTEPALPLVQVFNITGQTVVHLTGEASRGGDLALAASSMQSQEEILPVWKADCGELWYGGQLVKELSPQAKNQRAMFDSFQELHWVHVMDDPLTGTGVDRKERLGHTVQGMNTNLINPLLIFHTWSGNRIKWGVRPRDWKKRKTGPKRKR
jgi:hypothetical protein